MAIKLDVVALLDEIAESQMCGRSSDLEEIKEAFIRVVDAAVIVVENYERGHHFDGMTDNLREALEAIEGAI